MTAALLLGSTAPALVAQDGDPEQGGAAPRVDVEVTERVYKVRGDSLGAVVAQLNRMRVPGAGGSLSQGATTYDIVPEYTALARGGTCRVADLRLDVRISIVLPRWPGLEGRPAEERRRWGVIEEAIREHEYVHRDLTVEGARALARSLEGREARGCRALRQVVQGQLSVHGARIREAHADFDRSAPRTLPIG